MGKNENLTSEWILKIFYNNNAKYLDNSYIGDKFITDIIYFSYYIKNPIFYMIFAQKYLYDKKIIYDYYNDYSMTVKNPYEYRFKSALLLPSLDDYDKNMLNEADITFIDDLRFRFKQLDRYMKWFHTNYADLYNDEYTECLLSEEFNEASKKFIRMHVDNMLNHRKIILKFLSRYSSVIKYDDFNHIYDNHFIQRIKNKDLDLFNPDKFVEQFINDLEKMNKEYVHSVLDIIKIGIIHSEYIKNIDDIESINFYTNKNINQLYKNSEYFKDMKNDLLDSKNNVNNMHGLFLGALHLLWTNYYHWQPYCEIYNNMMSYNIYFDENMIKSLCNNIIDMVNIKYKDDSNKLFYKSCYIDIFGNQIESTGILSNNDNINILDIISMNSKSLRPNDVEKFIIHYMGDICVDMMLEYQDQIICTIQNLISKYNISNIKYHSWTNNSMFLILYNFINNKPFLFCISVNYPSLYGRITIIFEEDKKYHISLNREFDTIDCDPKLYDMFAEFDLEYQKIIKSLKNKYLDEIKNKIYNIKVDNDIETIICKLLYLYPNIVQLVPELENIKLCDKTDNIDNKLFNNLIKRLNDIENEQEYIRQEFRGDSYLKITENVCK